VKTFSGLERYRGGRKAKETLNATDETGRGVGWATPSERQGAWRVVRRKERYAGWIPGLQPLQATLQ